MADWYFLLIFLLHETITSPRKENVLLYFSFVTVRSVDNTICQEELSYMHTIPICGKRNVLCHENNVVQMRYSKRRKDSRVEGKGFKI